MAERWKVTILVCLTVMFGPCLADNATWHSEAGQSELQFVAHYDGQALNGRFNTFSVRVMLDQNRVIPIALHVTVAVASADMNDRDINDELGQADWFDADTYPEAVYRSETIEQVDDLHFIAAGTLSLKGSERKTNVPFKWEPSSGSTTMTGALEMSRHDWNIGAGEWLADDKIAESVQLSFQLLMTPKPESN